MTELFRSAFNYLSSTPTNATVIGRSDHPLVGTTVDIDGTKLKIRSLIAEGGYALVFSAQDMQGNWFALKRQLAADQDAAKTILKEIRFLKELSDLPAILHFVQAARLSPQESGHGRAEFLLLTELCPGSVINLIQKGPLSLSQVTKIFYAACIAIKQMHSKKPPITHRDMKVENLLFDAFGNVKLCDFGSATTEIILPDETWSVSKRTQLEEEFARHTTPMYRAPELLDTYSNFPVGPALDIWALGCVLYYLCYRKHPFEDSAKLRIINAKYSLPNSETEFTIMHQLIQKTLKVDPRERPLINDLCERIEKLAVTLAVDLSKPIENLQLPLLSPVSSNHGQLLTESHRNERERSSSISKLSPSLSRKIDYEQTAQQASAMFGAFKGQSMLWLKNIKDKTTAVAQTVQSTYGHRGPDVTFVTSRLVMAPLFDAVPESLICHAEEIVWDYVMNQTRGHLGVYNLSNRHLRCDYGFHVVETPLPTVGSGLTPTVNVLLNLCRNMTIFLKEKKTNIIFITGSEASCLLVSAALLLYTRLVSRPLSALELIFTKRRPYKLLPSYYRQLDIISTVVSLESRCLRIIVHNRRVILHSLSISPVPLFNRARTGCRPFVDMYCDGRKVWSTYKNYEELKLFDVSNSSVLELSLESIAVEAEVQIIVFHARWSKIQNRMQQLFMFSLSFHASFIDPNTHLLELNRSDIDYQIDDNSKFGESMRIGVKMEIDVRDRGYDTKKLPAFLSYDSEAIPNVLLTSQREEFDSLMRCIDCHHCKSSKSPPQRPPPPQKRITCKEKETESSIVTPLKDSFFSTLDWHDGTTSMKDTQCVFVAEAREENLQQPELIPSVCTISERLACNKNFKIIHALQNQLPHEKFSNNDIAKLCEQTDGIKISVVEEGMSSHHHKSDLQKQFETMDKSIPENFNDDVDLLGLGADLVKASCSSNHNPALMDSCKSGSLLFTSVSSCVSDDFHPDLLQNNLSASHANKSKEEILLDFNDSFFLHFFSILLHLYDSDDLKHKLHHSTPVFSTTDPGASMLEMKTDLLNDFLTSAKSSSTLQPKILPETTDKAILHGQQQPCYERAHFDVQSSTKASKSKNLENAFDDLLTSQGFQATIKSVKSLSEMKREEEIKGMDPVKAKVKDWTNGKERNIRALLGSLNDVLWPSAENWVQPSIGDLLTSQNIKKYYRKACLVVHPDKQVGTENEALARSIFTELNDAWTCFENAGSMSM